MEFTSHLGKKLFLPGLLDVMLYELDIQHLKKKRLLNLPKEGETVLQSSCFMKEFARHSIRHRRKQLMDFAIIRQNRSSNFMLHGKVFQILWACKLKMGASMIQKNFA